MQRFMAELSRSVDLAEFEKSWLSDPKLAKDPKVDFTFAGQRVSACVHSKSLALGPSLIFTRRSVPRSGG